MNFFKRFCFISMIGVLSFLPFSTVIASEKETVLNKNNSVIIVEENENATKTILNFPEEIKLANTELTFMYDRIHATYQKNEEAQAIEINWGNTEFEQRKFVIDVNQDIQGEVEKLSLKDNEQLEKESINLSNQKEDNKNASIDSEKISNHTQSVNDETYKTSEDEDNSQKSNGETLNAEKNPPIQPQLNQKPLNVEESKKVAKNPQADNKQAPTNTRELGVNNQQLKNSDVEYFNNDNAIQNSVANVSNAKEFQTALQNKSIHVIQLQEDIVVGNTIGKFPEINRSLQIEGNNHKLTYSAGHDFTIKTNSTIKLSNIKIHSNEMSKAAFNSNESTHFEIVNVSYEGFLFIDAPRSSVYFSGENNIETEKENVISTRISFQQNSVYKGQNNLGYIMELKNQIEFKLDQNSKVHLNSKAGGGVRTNDIGDIVISENAYLEIHENRSESNSAQNAALVTAQETVIELLPKAKVKLFGTSSALLGNKRSELIINKEASLEAYSTGSGAITDSVIEIGEIQQSRGGSLLASGGGTATRTILNFVHDDGGANMAIEDGSTVDLINTSSSKDPKNSVITMHSKGSFQFEKHRVDVWLKDQSVEERAYYSWSMIENIQGRLEDNRLIELQTKNNPQDENFGKHFDTVFKPNEFRRILLNGSQNNELKPPSLKEVTDIDEMITGNGTPGTQIIIEDSNGENLGEAIVKSDGKFAVHLTKPLNAKKVIYGYLQTTSGLKSQKTQIVVKGVRLELKSVPQIIEFETTIIEPLTKTIHRDKPSMSIEIMDTRSGQNNWDLRLKEIEPLTSISNKGHVLRDSFIFVQKESEQPITSAATSIYQGVTETENITQITWNDHAGLLIKTNLANAYAESYSASLEWSLVDAP